MLTKNKDIRKKLEESVKKLKRVKKSKNEMDPIQIIPYRIN